MNCDKRERKKTVDLISSSGKKIKIKKRRRRSLTKTRLNLQKLEKNKVSKITSSHRRKLWNKQDCGTKVVYNKVHDCFYQFYLF